MTTLPLLRRTPQIPAGAGGVYGPDAPVDLHAILYIRRKYQRALEGHTNWVSSVAFSPDGATLASGSVNGTVRLWRVADGALLRTLKGHTDTVRSVAFSPDGATLASGSGDTTVRLWRVADGELLRTLEGHTDTVWSVAFSPDGAILASGSDDHTVRLWWVAP